MATFYNWSTTPASNASVGNIDWAEGMAPSQVNNSARQEMADVAAWRDFFGGAKTTSGTDTITLTSGMTITAYASNQLFVAKLGGTNTGAATLNIDSLGTKAVEINGSAVTAGELVAGKFYMFVYDGTAFQASRVSAESGFTNPMTTQGDMIRGGGSGAAERVAIGAANTVLISDATDADWSKLPIASLANGTDGEIITWDAAGDPAVVATGTAGQILTSGGAGVAPTFATPAAPGLVFLDKTVSASTPTTIEWTDIGTTYDTMHFVISNLTKSTGTESYAQGFQVGYGATPTWITTNGYDGLAFRGYNAVAPVSLDLNVGDDSGDFIRIGNSRTTGEATNAVFTLTNLLNTSVPVGFLGHSLTNYSGHMYHYVIAGQVLSDTNAVTAIRIMQKTGNLGDGCTILRYGMAEA